MSILRVIPPFRGIDTYGSGAFKASRGGTFHKGVDFAVAPKSEIICPIEGRVTKLGYPYEDDFSFRYVQITDDHQYDWRFFYVSPLVEVGQLIPSGSVIGTSQSLSKRYPGINPHFHLEIKSPFNEFINPMELLHG